MDLSPSAPRIETSINSSNWKMLMFHSRFCMWPKLDGFPLRFTIIKKTWVFYLDSWRKLFPQIEKNPQISRWTGPYFAIFWPILACLVDNSLATPRNISCRVQSHAGTRCGKAVCQWDPRTSSPCVPPRRTRYHGLFQNLVAKGPKKTWWNRRV